MHWGKINSIQLERLACMPGDGCRQIWFKGERRGMGDWGGGGVGCEEGSRVVDKDVGR